MPKHFETADEKPWLALTIASFFDDTCRHKRIHSQSAENIFAFYNSFKALNLNKKSKFSHEKVL